MTHTFRDLAIGQRFDFGSLHCTKVSARCYTYVHEGATLRARVGTINARVENPTCPNCGRPAAQVALDARRRLTCALCAIV